jgi:hypothetical protein
MEYQIGSKEWAVLRYSTILTHVMRHIYDRAQDQRRSRADPHDAQLSKREALSELLRAEGPTTASYVCLSGCISRSAKM